MTVPPTRPALPATMQAMRLHRLAPLAEQPDPLVLEEVPTPQPGRRDLLVQVHACGVCHTELDEIEGRLPPPRLPVIPGHEVIGRIVAMGADVAPVAGHRLGERVGIGWIHSSDGSELENLSPAFQGTGKDRDGGYAEFMTVPAPYAAPIPDVYTDVEAAPLLCAGAVGHRALRLAQLRNGQTLGLTGFGGSAHLVLQLARHRWPDTQVYVFARDPEARTFALELGAAWAGDTTDRAPQAVDAIIDTTPAWLPVREALANLAPGGRLVINAIRKEAGDQHVLQGLSYHQHLWMERQIQSVANVTAADIRGFLAEAAAVGIRPRVETYPLEQANRALRELRTGPVRGAKVLLVSA